MDEARLKKLTEELTVLLLQQNDSERELMSLKIQIRNRAKLIAGVNDEIDELYREAYREKYPDGFPS